MDAPDAAQRPYAFVLGDDGHLWANAWDGANYQWYDQGKPPAVAITAGAGALTVMDAPDAAQRPYVFVLGDDGHLWANAWDGANYQWYDQGTPPAVAITAAAGALPDMGASEAAHWPSAFELSDDRHLL